MSEKVGVTSRDERASPNGTMRDVHGVVMDKYMFLQAAVWEGCKLLE